MDEEVEIGVVAAVNPARREIRVELMPGRDDTVEDLPWVRIVLSDGAWMRCKVASAAAQEGKATISFVAGVTRDNIGRMRKARVFGAPPVRSEAADTDRAISTDELIGLIVCTESGARLGAVTEVFATAAHAVIEIEKPGGGMILLPWIEEVAPRVDLGAGIVVVGDVTAYAVDDADDNESRLV